MSRQLRISLDYRRSRPK